MDPDRYSTLSIHLLGFCLIIIHKAIFLVIKLCANKYENGLSLRNTIILAYRSFTFLGGCYLEKLLSSLCLSLVG